MAISSKALKNNNQKELANEMCERIMASSSYDDALSIMLEYIVAVEEYDYDYNDDIRI